MEILCEYFTARNPECHDGGVSVKVGRVKPSSQSLTDVLYGQILKSSRVRRGMWQGTREPFPSLYADLTPNILLHRFIWLHPWATGFTEARGARNGFL